MPPSRERSPINWINLLWVVFLVGLALLPPVNEIHKQITLLAILIFQLMEGWLIERLPERGRAYSVIIKILLATVLLDHTGDVAINSLYYPVYFLPVVTAAIYFGPLATLAWTTLSCLAYLSLLIPALEYYELDTPGQTVLIIRLVFFYMAAVLVNRFVMENRQQVQRLQTLSGQLEETNRQLRRAEAEVRRRERLAALGQMSAGLAHEIRNPLAVIKGSAEMMGRKVADSEPLAAELAGFISSEVNRLNGLVVRFLDFARPSRLELSPENLPEIMDHALESVKAQYPDAQVGIERHYAQGLPRIPVDRQLCEQVFINLITNAFQAMEGRPGTLRLAMEPERFHEEPGVGITIEDNGSGVPEELREQIFNPFFTSKKDGVGLGLSIVAKIIDDHHGFIRLENNGSKGGARFHIFFPQSNSA